jgi:hypothetical protein
MDHDRRSIRDVLARDVFDVALERVAIGKIDVALGCKASVSLPVASSTAVSPAARVSRRPIAG